MLTRFILILFFLLKTFSGWSQAIHGSVTDAKNNEGITGALVTVKGTHDGAACDIEGNFSVPAKSLPPVVIVITFLGYEPQEIKVTDFSLPVKVKMKASEVKLKDVEITGSRVSEKQRESPLTVESLDLVSIRQAPQTSFYEALGTLKGVDLTSASLGFTIVNTRGFNSTSPVRSLQLIDGVDNQSPGLNFSLGNFLGSSELDVLKVDLIAGASSAYYGPNAFNGVINMTTRSPFVKPGLEVSYKAGERSLYETAFRYAVVVKNKNHEDRLGIKANFSYLRANDWEADNLAPTPGSKNDARNPGGYDAVNIYGDEYYSTSDFSKQPATNPGLITYYRTGYHESDLVDYNTRNIKASLAAHYKFISSNTELIAASNFGNGTTVYQGDNRYSLKNISFFQHRIEFRKENKFFIRVYRTNEDAGQSYDAVFTSYLLQQASMSDFNWSQYYRGYWALPNVNYFNNEKNLPGFPQPPAFGSPDYSNKYLAYLNSINPFLLNNYYDSLVLYHNSARNYTDNLNNPAQHLFPFYQPGTARFDSAFSAITTRRSFSQGGSGFYDKSSLIHAQGEYKFSISKYDFTTGLSYRLYTPNSDGTIFSDTSGRVIHNFENGIYLGGERKFFNEKLKVNGTIRFDKNENFKLLSSQATSLVYSLNENNIFRLSTSSAIRNPTLTDQYLYYNVGRATLVGNLEGYDSLVTIESLMNATSGFINIDTLVYFHLDPVQPEKVKTIEVGYRAGLFERMYADLNYYYSTYTDFIGYQIAASLDAYHSPVGDQIELHNIYRIASNAKSKVSSQGFSIGLNYFIGRYLSATGNYSWNELTKGSPNDPIIPGYNTPKNKFNIGLNAHDADMRIGNKFHLTNFGFAVNYKWVKGFLFEGSPQFTGKINDYGIADLQLNKKFPDIHCTFKIGASNLLNNKHYEVYGGPLVGRLAYVSVVVELE